MIVVKTEYNIGDKVCVIDFNRGCVAEGYVSGKVIQVVNEDEVYVFLNVEDINSRPIAQQINENFVFKSKDELKAWVESITKL